MVNKIAISGKANAGKNTLADMLGKILKPNNYRIIAFADPIKRIVLEMFPSANEEFLWGPSALRNTKIEGAVDSLKNHLTYRQVLLDLGKLGRSYNSDIWIDATIQHTNKHLRSNPDDLIIIADVRFRNELSALKRDGFTVCRITRPTNNFELNDISEVDLDGVPDSEFHFVIHNDGSINSLAEKAKNLANQFS